MTINGTSDNNNISGTSGNDSINGLGGADNIWSGWGDDTVNGGQGSDTIHGGYGDDSLNGDEGTDAIYGGDGNDTVHGGLWNDTVNGDAGNDLIYGDHGNDVLAGNAGDDTLVGGAGNDSLYGGAGDDVLNYQQETGSNGVNVNLATGTATDTFGHTDTFSGIERVHGTTGDDTLTGSDNDILETFYTYGGSNIIDGGDGHSRYFVRGDLDGTVITVGTDFYNRRDVINIGFADDEIVTKGDITVNGLGTMHLQTEYQHHLVFEYLHTGVTVNLGGLIDVNGNGVFDAGIDIAGHKATWDDGTGGDGSVSFVPYFLEVEGTHHDDVLIGGEWDELEWYTGNAGADTIHGGDGTDDTVVYENEDGSGASGGVTVNLDDNGATTGYTDAALETAYVYDVTSNGYAIDRHGDRDVLINIDDVRATSGNDNLVGSGGDNAFWGLAGDDTIEGGVGNADAAHYRADVDNQVGNPALPTTGIVVDLLASSGPQVTEDGYGDQDILSSIEYIYGNDFADVIRGNNANNRFEGYGGNDILSGGFGNDVLVGWDGNDSLEGGGNNDALYGDAGNDTLIAGAGTDTLFGGSGDDVFFFASDITQGVNEIRDFEDGMDTLRFDGTTVDQYSHLTITANGGDARVSWAGGSVELIGINSGVLTSADFEFV